jgi:CheY-like chemotaxis protein
VTTVGSGEEALKSLERLSPTVVLLDIKMPGMDGLVTLKKIKTLRPNTTVIMITGLHEEGTIDQALALGALDYITKPFSREYLETTLLSKILLGQTSQ